MRRLWLLLGGGAVAGALAAGSLTLAQDRSGDVEGLSFPADQSSTCIPPRASTLVFGTYDVRTEGDAPVRIRSVELVEPVHVELRGVFIGQPADGFVGYGNDASLPDDLRPPEGWDATAAVGAVLEPGQRFVFLVEVAPTADKGWAERLRVEYEVDGEVGTRSSNHALLVGRCNKLLDEYAAGTLF